MIVSVFSNTLSSVIWKVASLKLSWALPVNVSVVEPGIVKSVPDVAEPVSVKSIW